MGGSGLLWFILIAALILSLAYSVGGHMLLRPVAFVAIVGFLIFAVMSLFFKFR